MTKAPERDWRGRAAAFIARRSMILPGLVGGLAFFLMAQIPRLTTASSVDVFLDWTNPAARYFREFKKEFPKEEYFLIAFEDEAFFSAGSLGRLRALTQDLSTPTPGTFSGSTDASLLVSAAQLQQRLGDNQLTLLDARGLPRFRGEVEPIDPVAGHIPGAQCAAFTDNLDSDGHFLSPEQLRQRFTTQLGDRPATGLVAYCGSGVTACHNLFALCLAGYPLAPLYAGSWSEWITDPTRPVATGD